MLDLVIVFFAFVAAIAGIVSAYLSFKRYRLDLLAGLVTGRWRSKVREKGRSGKYGHCIVELDLTMAGGSVVGYGRCHNLVVALLSPHVRHNSLAQIT